MSRLEPPAGAGALALASAGGADVPGEDDWLSPGELLWLSARRMPKRRADWRLGRWVAKDAVLGALGSPPLRRASLEILAGGGGAPLVRVREPGPWPGLSISLSHSEGRGFAAALQGELGIGCDLERIAPRSEAFVQDYFTAAEAAWIRAEGAERDLRATLVWSAKEAVLKAMGEGLRLDTRSVEVVDPDVPREEGSWSAVTLRAPSPRGYRAWWRWAEGFVWALATARAEVPGKTTG